MAYGVQPGNITVGSGDNDDQAEIPIPYIPKPPGEASLQPLITQIDLPGALALLDAQLCRRHCARSSELRMSEAMRSGLSGEALGRAFSDVAARTARRAATTIWASAGASNGNRHSRGEGYDPAFKGF